MESSAKNDLPSLSVLCKSPWLNNINSSGALHNFHWSGESRRKVYHTLSCPLACLGLDELRTEICVSVSSIAFGKSYRKFSLSRGFNLVSIAGRPLPLPQKSPAGSAQGKLFILISASVPHLQPLPFIIPSKKHFASNFVVGTIHPQRIASGMNDSNSFPSWSLPVFCFRTEYRLI